MAAASKSSQKVKTLVLALLALWSLVSLVVIVVWATSPDLKSSAHYRGELKESREKLEGAKVVWKQDREALERLVEEAREAQARQEAANLLLVGALNHTNASLQESLGENAVLHVNISVLQENLEELRQVRANLTAQLSLKEDLIEDLQQNLTLNLHQTRSCFSLKDAAESQKLAAQIQTQSCQATQQYLQKQLNKCKLAEPEEAKATPQEGNTPKAGSIAPPLASSAALWLLACAALHLVT